MPTFETADDWQRRPADLPALAPPRGVLLGDPSAFDVVAAINAHMTHAEGRLNAVDPEVARAQWEELLGAYRDLGLEVAVLPAQEGLPDLCFTANPSLFLPLPDGSEECWLARMAHSSRAGEVEHHAAFAQSRGIPVREMPPWVERFEGCGDGLLHPRRFLMHAGIGPRTELAAWEALSAAHPQLDILLYKLADERFYHLDTALVPLDERRAMIVAAAFQAEGLELVRAAFPGAWEVPLDEALRFAANAHCPDGRHVLLQAGCPRTAAELEERGFRVIELETGEFRKSGGSVFCLKQTF